MRRGGGGAAAGGDGTTMTTVGGTTTYVGVTNDFAPRAAAAHIPDKDAVGTMREDGFTPATAAAASRSATSESPVYGVAASSLGVQSPVPPRSPPSSGAGGGMLRPAQSGPLEVDDANDNHPGEEVEECAKVRHWKNSGYAVGLVELTWEDEVNKGSNDGRPRRNCCAELRREDAGPSCCCLSSLAMSGMVCPLLGAKRVGNMVILKESVRLTVGSSDDEGEGDTDEAYDADNLDGTDEERGMMVGTRRYRTNLDCVLGPYWPFALCITYPLVYGLTLLTLVKAVPKKHPVVIVLWFGTSLVLCVSLYKVSCTDPGIMRRRRRPPPATGGARWRWNDSSLSYLSRSARYDADCACVVEEFDHVCPWTGTAIGKNNTGPFKAFMATWFVCLVMDILLLTGVL